ncbi:hypothetical protein TSTA_022960 [Talaromyces stipitatus ATCC 10500]|uniref:Uncharacterized protein n=1 Tax=Talaromyces stipitatus (strain ATCC 10500 / CBS 375.48 / QM 6759 / NRRL 1006) TaxID=441959 RepID=B8MEV9_TALSN|nr:uncharacterized protein TSTA_022960 [Talaromyces stipitatus ATCC 10500]EED17242.1 hypothetical protein TSTA_022960 [Talaromyces stipitatus ATCC 10500]
MVNKNTTPSDNDQDNTESNFPNDRWITEIGFNNETRRKLINMALWDKEVEPGDNKIALSTRAISALYYAACNQYVDYEIFMWLLDYFGNWTHDDFKRLSVHIQKKIKDMLMDRGIFVDYIGRKKTIAKALDDLVQMTRMPEWPHEIAAAKAFDSRSKMAKGQFPQLATKNGSEEEEPEVIASLIEDGREDYEKGKQPLVETPKQASQDHDQQPKNHAQNDKPSRPYDHLSLPGPAYTYLYRSKLEDDWRRQTPRYTIAPPAPKISMSLEKWDD